MTVYDEACRGWQGEPVLSERHPAAVFAPMALPVLALVTYAAALAIGGC